MHVTFTLTCIFKKRTLTLSVFLFSLSKSGKNSKLLFLLLIVHRYTFHILRRFLLNQQIKQYLSFLRNKRKQLCDELLKCPDGKLMCFKNGSYTKWYVKINGQSIYIPKKSRATAEEYAMRRYLENQIAFYDKEIQAVEMYFTHSPYGNPALEKNLFPDKELASLLKVSFTPLSEELAHWQNEPFKSNPYYPEKLIHDSPSGHLLRSKSEGAIDMFLFLNRIPFRYECELELINGIYYPDFTIRHPQNGKKYYWEHFGIMDDPDYVHSSVKKIENYCRNGIYPDVNLICTYETANNPLTYSVIEEKINRFFR